MKVCSKCKVPKPLEDFHRRILPSGKVSRRSGCKVCERVAHDKWIHSPVGKKKTKLRRAISYAANPAPAIARAALYAKENPKKVRAAFLRRYAANPAKVKHEAGKWAREHPAENREAKKRAARLRYSRNPQTRIVSALRTRLRGALHGTEKARPTLELLGCPPVWLEAWLESLFLPGMTLQNHGPVWHIDHIKPCSAFDLTNSEQQKICFHWTNLQPLFVKDNLIKGDTYDP